MKNAEGNDKIRSEKAVGGEGYESERRSERENDSASLKVLLSESYGKS